MGRPGGPHRFTARLIWRSLNGDDEGVGGRGWWIEQEAEVRFGDRLAVPDLSGWRICEGDAIPPSFVYENPITRSPDWCCELLSSSTETIDRQTKLPLYAQFHVDWAWLVDPVKRRIEVFQVKGADYELVEAIDGEVHRVLPPFASVVETASWWLRSQAG